MDKPERILATALKLFVTYGFHGTPTSKIASDAGVSNGTLFHYFNTKDELVVALYTSIREELGGFLDARAVETGTVKDRFRNFFTKSVEWAIENREAFYFLQQFRFSPHLNLVSDDEIRKQTASLTQLLEEAQALNQLKPLPTALLATLAANQIYGIYQYLSDHSLPSDQQQQMLENGFELTWAMIAKPEIQ